MEMDVPFDCSFLDQMPMAENLKKARPERFKASGCFFVVGQLVGKGQGEKGDLFQPRLFDEFFSVVLDDELLFLVVRPDEVERILALTFGAVVAVVTI